MFSITKCSTTRGQNCELNAALNIQAMAAKQRLPGTRRVSCVPFWPRPHSDRPPYGTSAYCSSQISHDNLDTRMVFHLKPKNKSTSKTLDV